MPGDRPDVTENRARIALETAFEFAVGHAPKGRIVSDGRGRPPGLVLDLGDGGEERYPYSLILDRLADLVKGQVMSLERVPELLLGDHVPVGELALLADLVYEPLEPQDDYGILSVALT